MFLFYLQIKTKMSNLSAKLLEEQAKLKYNKKNLFAFLGAPDDSKEEAALLFKQAASKYFTEKSYDNAIRCIKQSLDIYLELKNYSVDVKSNMKLLLQYSLCSENCGSDTLINLRKNLADIYSINGDLVEYNDQYIEISKILEKDGKLDEALKQLLNCAVDKMYGKVLERKGELLIKLCKYEDAAKVFQTAGEKYIEKSTLTGPIYARSLFFASVLNAMATKNIVFLNNQLRDISNFDPSFQNCIEGKNVGLIVKSLNDGNVEEFENACKSYESYKKLTPQQVDLLIIAKETIDASIHSDINNYTDAHECTDADIC